MAAEPPRSDANLEALCDILGDTGTGLTGSEIGRFLRECNIDDPLPNGTVCSRPCDRSRALTDTRMPCSPL